MTSSMSKNAREPEPGAELSTSSAECHNQEIVRSETVKLTAQVVPQTAKTTKSVRNLGGWLT